MSIVLLSILLSAIPASAILGDLDKDGDVDFDDFFILADQFGKTGAVEPTVVYRTLELRNTGSVDLQVIIGDEVDTLYVIENGFVDSVMLLSRHFTMQFQNTGSIDIQTGPIARDRLVVPNREDDIVFGSRLSIIDIKWAFTGTERNIDGTIFVDGRYSVTVVLRNASTPDLRFQFRDDSGQLVEEVKPRFLSRVSAGEYPINLGVSDTFSFLVVDEETLQSITGMTIGIE